MIDAPRGRAATRRGRRAGHRERRGRYEGRRAMTDATKSKVVCRKDLRGQHEWTGEELRKWMLAQGRIEIIDRLDAFWMAPLKVRLWPNPLTDVSTSLCFGNMADGITNATMRDAAGWLAAQLSILPPWRTADEPPCPCAACEAARVEEQWSEPVGEMSWRRCRDVGYKLNENYPSDTETVRNGLRAWAEHEKRLRDDRIFLGDIADMPQRAESEEEGGAAVWYKTRCPNCNATRREKSNHVYPDYCPQCENARPYERISAPLCCSPCRCSHCSPTPERDAAPREEAERECPHWWVQRHTAPLCWMCKHCSKRFVIAT